MVEVGVMSSVNKYTPVRVQSHQTMSFGIHRQSDRPASAMRPGQPSMPAAWQTRGIEAYNGASQQGAHVRSIGDIIFDPIRWALSGPLHKAASAVVACVFIAAVLF